MIEYFIEIYRVCIFILKMLDLKLRNFLNFFNVSKNNFKLKIINNKVNNDLKIFISIFMHITYR